MLILLYLVNLSQSQQAEQLRSMMEYATTRSRTVSQSSVNTLSGMANQPSPPLSPKQLQHQQMVAPWGQETPKRPSITHTAPTPMGSYQTPNAGGFPPSGSPASVGSDNVFTGSPSSPADNHFNHAKNAAGDGSSHLKNQRNSSFLGQFGGWLGKKITQIVPDPTAPAMRLPSDRDKTVIIYFIRLALPSSNKS